MTAIPTIDLSDELVPRQRSAARALQLLSMRVDPTKWAVVGGLMVLIVGREFGRRSRRAEATKDADVLVDLVTDPTVLGTVVHELREGQGFRLEDPIGDDERVARCTFSSGNAQIDLLCPDDTPPGQLIVDGGMKSIAIPGGRRALQTARLLDLYVADDQRDARVRVPTLAGAIATKAAAAVDPRTSQSNRHIQDVAFMLSLPMNVMSVAGSLIDDDRALLRSLRPRLDDRTDAAWAYLDDAERSDAVGALAFLVD